MVGSVPTVEPAVDLGSLIGAANRVSKNHANYLVMFHFLAMNNDDALHYYNHHNN